MGSTLRRRSRRWLPHAVAMVALLCALPSTASAAPSSYDRLANVSHTSLAGTGGSDTEEKFFRIIPAGKKGRRCLLRHLGIYRCRG